MLRCSFHSELSCVNICFLIDKLKFQILISALHLFNAKLFYKSKKWYLRQKNSFGLFYSLFLLSYLIFYLLLLVLFFSGCLSFFFCSAPRPPGGGDVGWVGGALYFNKSVSNSCSILNASNIHLAIRG